MPQICDFYEILSADLPETQVKADTKRKKETLATKIDLAETKSEILRWMFIFWIGQIGVLSGIIFAMLRLHFK